MVNIRCKYFHSAVDCDHSFQLLKGELFHRGNMFQIFKQLLSKAKLIESYHFTIFVFRNNNFNFDDVAVAKYQDK
jgi:hypothetical protein